MVDVASSASLNGPYAGNVLVAPLGPILTKIDIRNRHFFEPPRPASLAQMPPEVRLHHLLMLRDFYLPPKEAVDMASGLDLSLRSGYRERDPKAASTWAGINGGPRRPAISAPAPVSNSSGPSGTGKSAAVSAFASLNRQQIVLHKAGTFPHIITDHYQVVWLAANVHPSGKLVDIVASLMIAWDDAVTRALGPSFAKFESILVRYHSHARMSGSAMMSTFVQAARLHFLGILLLDEASNFWKLAPLRERRKKSNSIKDPELQLSLVEDMSLKTLLVLSNEGQIPIHLTGTDDGIIPLGKRLSTLERIVLGGSYRFHRANGPTDPQLELTVRQLLHHQWVQTKLPADEVSFKSLLVELYELTAGIWRLLLCLWISAHRIAFDRLESDLASRKTTASAKSLVRDQLLIDDIRKAARTYMAPVQPAVAAILSNSADAMRRYEDLIPRDPAFWSSFWSI